MSGNTLLIVCEPCMKAEEQDFGFKIAKRDVIGAYSPFGPAAATKNFTAWLGKHRLCGGKSCPDHFKMAYAGTHNYDQPTERPKLKAVN